MGSNTVQLIGTMAYEYPRTIEYLDALPLTATGKVMRRELRARSQSIESTR